MDAIETRSATPEDADAVAGYHQRCFRDTYASQILDRELEVPDLEATRQQLHDWFLAESGFETRVTVVDGAPVGHCAVSGCQLVTVSFARSSTASAMRSASSSSAFRIRGAFVAAAQSQH